MIKQVVRCGQWHRIQLCPPDPPVQRLQAHSYHREVHPSVGSGKVALK